VGLAAVNPQRCEWIIPGLLQNKIVALIKSLLKQLRKNFVPAPNFAEACVEALAPLDMTLETALSTALSTAVANHLKKMTGVHVPYDAWDENKMDQHLLMNFRVIDENGKAIEEGRDLQAIKNKLSGIVDDAIEESQDSGSGLGAAMQDGTQYDQDDVSPDSLDTMEESVEINMQGITIKAYPALVKDGRKVNLRALDNKKKAESETRQALIQFFINALPQQIKNLKSSIPDIQNLCLKYTDFGRCEDLKKNIVNNTIDDIFLCEPIKSGAEFKERLEKGRSELHDKTKRWSKLITDILDQYRAIKKLMKNPAMSQLDTVTDIQAQLNYLFPKNFITVIDQQWLQEYPRYLMAINKRFEKSKTNATRDRQLRIDFSRLWGEYIKRQETLEKKHIESEQLELYRWMLEEYRVSLFSQELKTKFPVSEKRLKKFWHELSV